MKVKVRSFSRVWLFETPWTVAYQASPSMEFSRQEYWSGLPFPSPGDLPDPGIEPGSTALEADALTSEPFFFFSLQNLPWHSCDAKRRVGQERGESQLFLTLLIHKNSFSPHKFSTPLTLSFLEKLGYMLNMEPNTAAEGRALGLSWMALGRPQEPRQTPMLRGFTRQVDGLLKSSHGPWVNIWSPRNFMDLRAQKYPLLIKYQIFQQQQRTFCYLPIQKIIK